MHIALSHLLYIAQCTCTLYTVHCIRASVKILYSITERYNTVRSLLSCIMISYTNNQNSGFYNCLCIGYDLLWGIICMNILSQVKLFKHKVWNISRFSVCALFSI